MAFKYLKNCLGTLAMAASMFLAEKSYSQENNPLNPSKPIQLEKRTQNNNNSDSTKYDFNFNITTLDNSLKIEYVKFEQHYKADHEIMAFIPWNYELNNLISLNRIKSKIQKSDTTKNNKQDKYALLVTGYDEPRFKHDISLIYQVLLESGFNKKNIFILDEQGREKFLYPSDGIATIETIEEVTSHLEKIVDNKDLFLMHISGHGLRAPLIKVIPEDSIKISELYKNFVSRSMDFEYPELTFQVYDSITDVGLQGKDLKYFFLGWQPHISSLTEMDLEKYLSNIKPKTGIVTTSVCYGGGIAKRLGKNNFIAISSSEESETAYISKNHSFIGYFYHAYRNELESDKNNDKIISLDEAFEYAKEKIKEDPSNPFIAEIWKTLPDRTPLLIKKPELDASKISLTKY